MWVCMQITFLFDFDQFNICWDSKPLPCVTNVILIILDPAPIVGQYSFQIGNLYGFPDTNQDYKATW